MTRKLIDVIMSKHDVPVLMIDGKAYVSEKQLQENRLIATLAARTAGESFSYEFVAQYGEIAKGKEKAVAENFSGKYVTRFQEEDINNCIDMALTM